jgi:hypothetical protein
LAGEEDCFGCDVRIVRVDRAFCYWEGLVVTMVVIEPIMLDDISMLTGVVGPQI